MQRVRMSIPYYKELGWEPVVLCVDDKFINLYKDDLLNETIPSDIEVHRIKAWPEHLTRKVGVGSLSLRSYYHFKKAGSKLLRERRFDLVFFFYYTFPCLRFRKVLAEKIQCTICH